MKQQANQCAREVLDVVPSVMRFIRAEMRSRRAELSVPQFRSLLYIARHDGCPLCDLAGHLGLTAPSTSKLIDVLERRSLVRRTPSMEDRRKLTLALTPAGERARSQAFEGAQEQLAARMGALTPADLQMVIASMSVLKRSFTGPVVATG
jgi:DNA-binding MarR family transcriptional regulator